MYGYIDMHCDTLLRSAMQGAGSIYDGEGMTNIRMMKEGGQQAQFFAVFFPPVQMMDGRDKELTAEQRKFSGLLRDEDRFFSVLRGNLLQAVEEHSDIIAMAYSGSDIIENSKNGRMSAVLTIEDGRMVNGSMEKLQYLYEQGVRAISLTWNFANCFGYPNSKDADIMRSGLTDFGRAAVDLMNDMGMLIDVSHLSDGGFYDVAALTKKPFVATHSNCRELCPHTRNLTDEMIRLLAEKGGVSGINFGPEFLTGDVTNKTTKTEYIISHILHFIDVGGEDCVGMGTDFDGIGGSFEIGHPTEMYRLFDGMKKKGITERQIDKIAADNVLRVMKDAITK